LNFIKGVVCEAEKKAYFDATYRLLYEILRIIYALCFPIWFPSA